MPLLVSQKQKRLFNLLQDTLSRAVWKDFKYDSGLSIYLRDCTFNSLVYSNLIYNTQGIWSYGMVIYCIYITIPYLYIYCMYILPYHIFIYCIYIFHSQTVCLGVEKNFFLFQKVITLISYNSCFAIYFNSSLHYITLCVARRIKKKNP